MKSTPRTGLSGEQVLVVGPSNRISFADARMPAVLATPWLVAHFEYAARDAIAGCLEDHERSVGTFVEVEHLAPAAEGAPTTGSSRSRGASIAVASSKSTASLAGWRGSKTVPSPIDEGSYRHRGPNPGSPVAGRVDGDIHSLHLVRDSRNSP